MTDNLADALKAAYYYINASDLELNAMGKKREDFLKKFHALCPDLKTLTTHEAAKAATPQNGCGKGVCNAQCEYTHTCPADAATPDDVREAVDKTRAYIATHLTSVSGDKFEMAHVIETLINAALRQGVTDIPIKPYEGWQIIVDQQGVSHHVPGSELLSKMSDKYYVPETDLAPKTVTREELAALVWETLNFYFDPKDIGGSVADALIAAGVVRVTD